MQQINKVLHPELSYKICGLCFETHNKLGRFKNEGSYADLLEILLKENNIKYVREAALAPSFVGEKERRNIPDFIIEDIIILDAKTKRIVTKEDYFQMKRYLISSNKKLGLIVNFRQKYLSPKRVLN
ncbi:MAG: GxxExxY protein [Patescibacteria group bacterium]